MFQTGDVVTTGMDPETISILKEFGVENPASLSADELQSEIIRIEQEINDKPLIGKGGTFFDYTNPIDYGIAGLSLIPGIAGISAAAKSAKIAAQLAKLEKLRKKLSIIKGKKPGLPKPGVKGFQPRPRFDPRSYEYDLGKAGVYAGLGAIGLGLSPEEYEQLPDEIQDALADLQEQQEEEAFTVEKDSESGDAESKENKKSKGITESDIARLQDLYLEAQVKAAEDYKKEKRNVNKQNIFLEEISGALAEGRGDIGYGFSTGAAKAAKRISEEEAAAAKAEAELLEKAKDKNTLSTTDKTTLAKDYSESIEHLDHMSFIAKEIEDLERMVKTGDVTGAKGFLGRVLTEAKGFIGFGDEIVNDATKSKQILKFLSAQLIRELLNESGRTISNLDRQLIEDIVGDIENLGSGRGALLEAVRRVKARVATAINTSRNKVAFIDAEFGAQLPNLAIYREGFGQRPQTSSQYEQDDVVVNQEDVIDVTEET